MNGRRTIFHRWLDRLHAPEPAPRGLAGRGLQLLRIFYFGSREFHRDECWERAGSLAFATILSLIPLTVLFLSFIGVFWGDAELRSFVETKLLSYLVPDPELRQSLWRIIQEQIRSTAFQFKTGVSVTAALGLVLASVALLVTAERVFNQLWKAPSSRTYLQKLRIFWIILTTSPVALAVSLYFDQVTRAGTVLGSLKEEYWLLNALYSFLLPALVSLGAFTIVNIFLPNTRVQLRPAILGALVTAILWESGKKGFYLYVQEAKNLSRFYGSLAIVPLFLLWIYVTWLIVLYGAELTRAAQRLPQLQRSSKPGESTCAPLAPILAVCLLERVYSAFESGARLPTLGEAAVQIGVPVEALEPVARKLVAAGVLTENGVSPVRYAPARAPRLVRIREVVETIPGGLLAEVDPGYAEDPGGARRVLGLFHGARRAFLDSLGEKTLEDVLINTVKKPT